MQRPTKERFGLSRERGKYSLLSGTDDDAPAAPAAPAVPAAPAAPTSLKAKTLSKTKETFEEGSRKKLLMFSAWNVFSYVTLLVPGMVFLGAETAFMLRIPAVFLASFVFLCFSTLLPSVYEIKIVFWGALFLDTALSAFFFYSGGWGGGEKRPVLEMVYYFVSLIICTTDVPILLVV